MVFASDRLCSNYADLWLCHRATLLPSYSDLLSNTIMIAYEWQSNWPHQINSQWCLCWTPIRIIPISSICTLQRQNCHMFTAKSFPHLSFEEDIENKLHLGYLHLQQRPDTEVSQRRKKIFSSELKAALNLPNSLPDISRACYCKCTPSDWII